MQRLISVDRNTTDGKYNKRQMINQTRHSCYQIESVLKFCVIVLPSKVHSFYDATTKNTISLKSFNQNACFRSDNVSSRKCDCQTKFGTCEQPLTHMNDKNLLFYSSLFLDWFFDSALSFVFCMEKIHRWRIFEFNIVILSFVFVWERSIDEEFRSDAVVSFVFSYRKNPWIENNVWKIA